MDSPLPPALAPWPPPSTPPPLAPEELAEEENKNGLWYVGAIINVVSRAGALGQLPEKAHPHCYLQLNLRSVNARRLEAYRSILEW